MVDAKDRRFLGAALFGLSYLLRRTAPSLCMADTEDIETDVSLHEEEATRWMSSLYLYDAHEGGVGYAEKIYERFNDALGLCLRILEECECECGCPSCVPPLPPGIHNEEMESFLVETDASVECTRSLLRSLVHGELAMPDVTVIRRPGGPPIQPPPVDENAIRLEKRLNKAAGILKKKREREH